MAKRTGSNPAVEQQHPCGVAWAIAWMWRLLVLVLCVCVCVCVCGGGGGKWLVLLQSNSEEELHRNKRDDESPTLPCVSHAKSFKVTRLHWRFHSCRCACARNIFWWLDLRFSFDSVLVNIAGSTAALCRFKAWVGSARVCVCVRAVVGARVRRIVGSTRWSVRVYVRGGGAVGWGGVGAINRRSLKKRTWVCEQVGSRSGVFGLPCDSGDWPSLRQPPLGCSPPSQLHGLAGSRWPGRRSV
jgi:hypothetical protein